MPGEEGEYARKDAEKMGRGEMPRRLVSRGQRRMFASLLSYGLPVSSTICLCYLLHLLYRARKP